MDLARNPVPPSWQPILGRIIELTADNHTEPSVESGTKLALPWFPELHISGIFAGQINHQLCQLAAENHVNNFVHLSI